MKTYPAFDRAVLHSTGHIMFHCCPSTQRTHKFDGQQHHTLVPASLTFRDHCALQKYLGLCERGTKMTLSTSICVVWSWQFLCVCIAVPVCISLSSGPYRGGPARDCIFSSFLHFFLSVSCFDKLGTLGLPPFSCTCQALEVRRLCSR